MNYLVCPVCKENIEMKGNSFCCLNNHSFDCSSKGYVNFLLSNQFRSSHPGDSKEMVLARKRFHEKEIYITLKEKLSKIVYDIIPESGVFCDLACGEGYYTNYISNAISSKNANSIGIDISKFAIIEASKKRKLLELRNNVMYIVGNLNDIPIKNNSVDVILNCFAPMYTNEFFRILKTGGFFIRVLPNAEHLYELKELLYKNPRYNKEKDIEHKGFKFIRKISIKEKKDIDKETAYDLFKMTPLYYKTDKKIFDKFNEIDNLSLTIDFVIYIYEKE